MGTPTTQSLRAKTGSFSNNCRGWNKFQTVFSLLLKPHQIQQRFGPNRTFFRLHYTNLYNNGKCTTTQLYSLNNKFGNAVMLVVMAGNAGCRGLSHRCWFQMVPGWLAQVSSSFLCLSCVLCHPWEFSLLPSPPGPRENGLVGWSGRPLVSPAFLLICRTGDRSFGCVVGFLFRRHTAGRTSCIGLLCCSEDCYA